MVEFTPFLTPYEMLELGIFDGKYYRADNPDFEHRPIITEKNLFAPEVSQSRKKWEENGWIKSHDPMGWFQWYVRYYQGRRIPEYDEWQIKRWRSFVARHGAQVKKGGKGDISKRLKQRQGLLHWAADPIPDVDMTREEKISFLFKKMRKNPVQSF